MFHVTPPIHVHHFEKGKVLCFSCMKIRDDFFEPPPQNSEQGDKESTMFQTCTCLHCPERTGGKCTAGQDTPIGVSQWKEMGRKYGYWDFFKEEIIVEERRRWNEKLKKASRESLDGADDYTARILEQLIEKV